MIATGNFGDAWLYMTAPIVGAIVAAMLHTGLVRLAHERTAVSRPGNIAQTPAESMLGVFEQLERRYGSVEGYLRSTGLTEEELERARARLRRSTAGASTRWASCSAFARKTP